MSGEQRTDYFDFIVQARQDGASWIAPLGDFNHWGYWDDPGRSRGSLAEMEASMQKLTDELLSFAPVRDGISMLDVGSGLGGTLRTVDGRHNDLRLFGLDQDDRLVEMARRNVPGSGTNRVEIQQGCATQLPFEDSSMDVITAVECIFHFPSRAAFLAEARRVLKPGGRLVLCDYLIQGVPPGLRRQQHLLARTPALKWLGHLDFVTLEDYGSLREEAGFSHMESRDITANTLPTYDTRVAFFRSTGLPMRVIAPRIAGMRLAELTSRMGIFRYAIIAMEKPLAEA